VERRARRASEKACSKRGARKSWAEQWLKEGVKVDREKPLPPKGFQVLPRRWVVERTFSWTEQNRRMSKKDYERLTETSEAFIYVAMSRLMARRLARLSGLFGQFQKGNSRKPVHLGLYSALHESSAYATSGSKAKCR
jgi:transposase